ncbi:MAG TPA: multiheme c-type cytochrome [Phycisphaerae bacterium]|nr:multiheme c-type cytochrome [Phycisphaerae bacterium]
MAMLGHEDARVRAAGCVILAAHPGETWTSAVFPRASDRDWRVRAAAMTALARFADVADAPPTLRDTPLQERERWLLAWLDAFDAAAETPLGPHLCEVYAGAGDLEFGRPLIDRCLACHAGARPAPPSAADACRRCHREVHEQWTGSAHAQSLSHLNLVTVNPETREPEAVGFGDLRGIGCFECHRAAGPPARDLAPDGQRGTACPYAFEPARPTSVSCARCHATTCQEWQVWRGSRQPRRATWPPGQVDVAFRGDDRGCPACHMPGRDADGQAGPRRHDWSARRNRPLLGDGIDVAAVRSRDEQGGTVIRFTLTNLSGHAFPTGTRRRLVRLYAGPEGGQADAVVTLAPVRPGTMFGAGGPALAPGGQQTVLTPVPPGASAMAYRLVYYRDGAAPRGYAIEILSGTWPLGVWPVP